MKKNYLSFCVFTVLFVTSTITAQTSVTASGISIQSIARDVNNSALANFDQLELVFKVCYLGNGNSEQPILTKTANVKTDNFGVFPYVLRLKNIFNENNNK